MPAKAPMRKNKNQFLKIIYPKPNFYIFEAKLKYKNGQLKNDSRNSERLC